MRILDFLSFDAIISSLEAGSKEAVLEELVEPIAKSHPNMDKDRLIQTLIERENLGSTGIGGGVAIPHGIDFSSMDNKPAFLFFLLIAPRNSAGEHLKALARISRLFKDPLLKSSLQHATSAEEIYDIIQDYDQRLP
jgi:PTS system nitrogen regulatory IIA component